MVAVAVEEKEDTARKGREVVEMAEDDDRRVGRRKRPIIVAGVCCWGWVGGYTRQSGGWFLRGVQKSQNKPRTLCRMNNMEQPGTMHIKQYAHLWFFSCPLSFPPTLFVYFSNK